MTPEQESNLTSQGDCQEHWHSSDRLRTHDDGRQLVNLEYAQRVYAGTHSVDPTADYVLVDSSGGSVTLTLPHPSKRLATTFVRTSALNTVTINTPSGVINGAATYSLIGAYLPVRLKAIDGNYYRVG